MFGFRSSEIFWKYPVFSNSRKISRKSSEKSSEKVRKLKFGNNFVYYSNFTSNTKISKKLCKIWGFRSKTLEKSLEKFGKCSEKVWKKFGNFGYWFFRMFGNFQNFGNLEIPNFPKITKKWRSTRNLKIAKNSFWLENRLESSVKSSEIFVFRRALVINYKDWSLLSGN